MLMFRFLFMYIIKKNAFYSEHSRQQAKHMWRAIPASALATARTLCLRLTANDHN